MAAAAARLLTGASPIIPAHRRRHPKGPAMELTAVLTPAGEGGFVAYNPETGSTTQGETMEEALANLKEATALHLAEFPLPAAGHPFITVFTVPEPEHA